MTAVRPLTPALSRPIIALINGRKTPVLIVIPADAHTRVIDQSGAMLEDPLAQSLTRSGWAHLGDPLRPHQWRLIADGYELAITDGEEYIVIAGADGAWLTHVIANGGLDVVYNPAGTPSQDDRLHISSPWALAAYLPLFVRRPEL